MQLKRVVSYGRLNRKGQLMLRIYCRATSLTAAYNTSGAEIRVYRVYRVPVMDEYVMQGTSFDTQRRKLEFMANLFATRAGLDYRLFDDADFHCK